MTRRPSAALALLLSAGPALGCPFLLQRRLTEADDGNEHPSLRAVAPADAVHAAARRRLQECAAEGEKAMDCYASDSSAGSVQSCCEDLVCATSGNTRKCVPPLMNVEDDEWPTEVRSINGTNNNGATPELGSAGEPLRRAAAAEYGSLNDADLPNPREVSNAIGAQTSGPGNAAGATDLLWQWGQFLDHDLSLTGHSGSELEPISVLPDPDDVLSVNGVTAIGFTRSDSENDNDGVRQQTNSITSFIDASHIYGSDPARAAALRANDSHGRGKLGVETASGDYFLPFNNDGLDNAGDGPTFFLAGDIRANEQVGLTALHTLFVREHNWWAKQIWARYGHGGTALSDDDIFERARMMVAAEMQAITYNEFLPVLLGEDWDATAPYNGYDSFVDPQIDNVFSTAAFRVGHTLVSDGILCVDNDGNEIAECSMSLSDLFFRPEKIMQHDIGPILAGLSAKQCQEVDTQVVDSLRNKLFANTNDPGFDLMARNIQRGRDHGLPGYNAVRAAFGLTDVADFSHFNSDVESALQCLYKSVDDMDPIVGMLAEEHVTGAMVGETLLEVLKDQFLRLRDGDRFWYENPGYDLPESLMMQASRCTLSDIVKRNTDATGVITFKQESGEFI